MPWAMRWPGRIAPGSVIDDPVIALDLMPTLIEYAGGTIGISLEFSDGRSLAARITGPQSRLPVRPLYWRKGGRPWRSRPASRAVEARRIREEAGSLRPLFDLSKDIGESRNLADELPGRVASMLKQLDAWESELMEPRWGPGAKGERAPRRRRRR